MADRPDIYRGLLRDEEYMGDTSVVLLKDTLVMRARGGQRSVRELDNLVNTRWYTGQPWYRRNPESNKLVGLAPDQRQRYVHVNKTFEVCRALKGVMFYEPDIEAKPKTVDTSDVARAEMTMSLGKHLIKNGDLAKAFSKTVDLCNITGLGWIKVFWDPSAGARRPMYGQVPCPICQGSGAVSSQLGPSACYNCSAQGLVPSPEGWRGAGVVDQYMGTEPLGDVVFQAVHMDDVFIDPEAEDLDKCEEIAIRSRMSKHRAWELYGKGFGLTEEDFERGRGVDDVPTSMVRMGTQFAPQPDPQYVRVWEYYRRPSEKHPEGIFGVIVGDRAVVEGPLPYVHDIEPFPVFPFPMYEVMGSLYPLGTIDLVLPLIVAYNDHLSTLHARARLTSKLRFKVPRSVNFEVDDRSGNVYYTPTARGDAPQELQLGSAPADLGAIVDVLAGAIESLSGATDVVRGQMSEVSSARAMAFIEERAVGPLKPIVADHTRRLDRVIRYAIDLARLFYDDGRLIRLEGANGGIEVREFRVENVGESSDVQVAAVRNLGRSRATLMAEINEAADRQMIDPETYQQLAEFGDMGDMYKERQMHRNQARTEEQLLLQTQQIPPPAKFQDHKTHLKSHQALLIHLQTLDPAHPLIPLLGQHMEATEFVQAQEEVNRQIMAQQAAQQFGMMNAGNPAKQPGQSAPTEPFNPSPPGGPESQPALEQASQTAAAATNPPRPV